jgi:hypothetical protein
VKQHGGTNFALALGAMKYGQTTQRPLRDAHRRIDHLAARNQRLRDQLRRRRGLNEAAHKLGGSR